MISYGIDTFVGLSMTDYPDDSHYSQETTNLISNERNKYIMQTFI